MAKFIISEHVSINANVALPKYEQISTQIENLVGKGILFKGQKLPPINEAYKLLGVSRDTVILAYKDLQAKNIVNSYHGRGFFVARRASKTKKRVMLLFDVMNGYKEVLYRSIVNHLGRSYEIDIHFHYYNIKTFESLIEQNLDVYDYFVIMPHFNIDVSSIVAKIPIGKRFLIDKDIESLDDTPAVFQDFEPDVYSGLNSAKQLILKYKRINFVSNTNFQFIPSGIINGFVRFCNEINMSFSFIDDLTGHTVKKRELYFLFNERDLVAVIKSVEKQMFRLGVDVGVISYDDTPLKEILKGGISVLTTYFEQMGELLSQMIKENKRIKIANKSALIVRKSL